MRSQAGSFPFTDADGTVWLAFVDWGLRRRDRIVVCVHGLTRQGRDFDALAKAISRDFQIIEVDVVGRGKSGWLSAKKGYNFETYLRHIEGLMDYRAFSSMDWVGTSMGGILGMLMASRPNSPIKKLVLNDIGAFIPGTELEKISLKVGSQQKFISLQEACSYFKEVHSEFGNLTEAEWSELTIHSINRESDGNYSLHYDPEIVTVFGEKIKDIDLWATYDQIECPVLLLRGERSSVLNADTAREMTKRGPMAELIEFPNCGHAPALMNEEQIKPVYDWLMKDLDEGGK